MQDRQPLHDVRQLAHVARPSIARQQRQRTRREMRSATAGACAVQGGEVRHERRDVVRALAQRRNFQRDHIQAEQEILAEPALGDGTRQVAVRRRDDPYVDADRLRTSHPLDLLRLDRAQELGLCLGAEVSHLVEEERPGVRELEPADSPIRRAGERALLVPEHLALHEIARDRRAVHAHEWAVAPRALRMNRRRDQLLPGPRLTRDEHAGVGRRHARDQLPHARHRGARADHLAREPEILAQRARLAPHAPQLERRREREQHPLGRQRLLEEVERAELRRLHRVAQAGPAAHHDHGHIGRRLAQAGQRA